MATTSKSTEEIEKLPPLSTRVRDSIGPALLMLFAIKHLGTTLWRAPRLPFQDWQKFRHQAFAGFWLQYGQAMSEELPGQTVELIRTASGTVLDIGPADGSLVHLFDPSKITMAYGPEPAVDMHPKLRNNITKAGLEGKYEPLAAGAEPDSLIPALAKIGLVKAGVSNSEEIFDTILSTRVLCGVHHPEETAKLLFKLLKPGGRMIVCEHTITPYPTLGTSLGYVLQTVFWALGWNFWMGGCTINRDTVKFLKDAGGSSGWRHFDIKYVNAWHPVPFVVGVLVKA